MVRIKYRADILARFNAWDDVNRVVAVSGIARHRVLGYTLLYLHNPKP